MGMGALVIYRAAALSLGIFLTLEVAHAQGDTASVPEHTANDGDRVSEKTIPELVEESYHEPAAADIGSDEVADAPRPDQARGVIVDQEQPGKGALWIPRSLLFIPRWILEIPFYPLRGILYLYEKGQIEDYYYRLFYNEERSFGVFPTAFFSTGFGINVGAGLVHKDLFGHQERFTLNAGYGGRTRQKYGGGFSSGRLFGDRVTLSLGGSFEKRPNERFFGIGNDGERTDTAPPAPVIVGSEDSAIDSRYRESVSKARLVISTDIVEHTKIRLRGLYRRSRFRNITNDRHLRVTDVYETSGLTGFDRGMSTLYTEVGLVFNTREPPNRYISEGVTGPGVRFEVFGGHVQGIEDANDASYFRYGLDLGGTVSLFGGDRNLSLRIYVDTVTGSFDEVPFVVLPSLGGRTFLRGYQEDRFRDRASTLASLEYIYPLTRMLSAYLFTDTGRVWRSLDDFSFDDYRWGYGGGVQFHTLDGFLGRFQFSGSEDGVFIVFVFNQPMEASVRG